MDAAWAGQQAYWAGQLDAQLGAQDPYVLYDLQLATAGVLTEASNCNNARRLDVLSKLYLRAYPYLNTTSSGRKKWLCGSGCLVYSNAFYTNQEVYLVSTQFVHALSMTSRLIARIPPSERTPSMVDFLDKYLPVIVNDHLRHWVFDDRRWEVYGWDCHYANGTRITESFTHADFTRRKLERTLGDQPGYCNSVTDIDLWIYASVAEMFGAQKNDPSAFSQRGLDLASFKPYLQDANLLIQSRLTPSHLTDFSGRPIQGLNFDLGVWDSHPEYAYTGYSGTSFPSASDAGPASMVGWDISHASRLVWVFSSLYVNRDATGSVFPMRETIAGLSNQLVYGVFNRDFQRPLFSNFMDGTNGWYRVDYSGRSNFGYGPYSMSDAVAYGGYGFWSEFNPDVRRVLQSVYDLLFVRLKAADSTGRHDGVSFALTEASARGRAARFRAPTDLVMVPNSQGLENLQEFTMEVRVKPASVNRSTYTILSRGVNGNAPYVWWVLDLRPAENTTWVELGDSNGQYRATSQALDWEADREYFLSFSWSNRLKTWAMTRDGVVVGNGTLSGDLHSGDHPLRVGSYSDTESTYFDGWIDEFRIFNRVVDSSELSDHFAGRFSNGIGLVGYWNFDAAYDADLLDHAKRYYSRFLAPRWMLTFWPTFASPVSLTVSS